MYEYYIDITFQSQLPLLSFHNYIKYVGSEYNITTSYFKMALAEVFFSIKKCNTSHLKQNRETQIIDFFL